MTWRFAPDVDPTTPEIYTDMARMLATPWGTYRTSPSLSAALGNLGGTNIASASALFLKTDGTARWIAGTPTKLFDSDATGVTWTDRSGAAYTSGAWQFAQFGDVTLATNLTNNIQASSSGAFADLAGTPPKAALICVQSNAVMLANYNDGSSVKDGWFASDVGSHTTWTGGESASGRLLTTPGGITCIIAYQGKVIAFKETSVYEGQYVGGVVKWAWRLLHPTIGVTSANGAATDGRLLFFYGVNGAWIYDGAQFTRVDDGVEKYLQSNFANTATSPKVIYSYAEQIFCVCGGSATFANFCTKSGLWGVGSDSESSGGGIASGIDAVVKVPPGYTRRVMSRTGSFSAANTVTGTTYNSVPSSVKTGWIGTDRKMTNVTAVIPLYVPAADYSYNNGMDVTTPAQLTVKTSYTRAGTMTEITGSPFNQDTTRARFNFTKTDRWFEFSLLDHSGFTSTGGMELSGLDVVAAPAGTD